MLAIFLGASAALLALSVWAHADLRRFLSRHAAIDNSTAFEEFKALARRNMYGALAYLVLGTAGLLAGIGVVWGRGLAGLAMVIAVHVVLGLLGQANKKLETTARTLPCSHPMLAEELRRVGETWVRKPLPNF